MNIKFEVSPFVYYDGKSRRIRLTFTSNINQAEFVVDKIFYDEQPINLRKRLIKDMFRELEDRVFESEDCFDNLLREMKESKCPKE